MSDPIDPFKFQDGEFWKDASYKLCVDGWPQVVVVLNCVMRDMKKAYDELWIRYQNDLRELGREEMIAETEHALSLILNKGEGDETNSV